MTEIRTRLTTDTDAYWDALDVEKARPELKRRVQYASRRVARIPACNYAGRTPVCSFVSSCGCFFMIISGSLSMYTKQTSMLILLLRIMLQNA